MQEDQNLKALVLLKHYLVFLRKNEHSPVAIELYSNTNNTPKHRKKQKKRCLQGAFFVDEERSGGVAAIEQTPQDES